LENHYQQKRPLKGLNYPTHLEEGVESFKKQITLFSPMGLFKKKVEKKKKTPKKTAEKKQDSIDLIAQKVEEGWLHVNVVLEMVGAPKEHVVKTFNDYLTLIDRDKELILVEKKVKNPKKQKELWSIFSELSLLFPDASALVFFCFDFMPSSIEIVEPELLHYRSQDFSAFFNDLQGKLHKLDFMAKTLVAENKNLKRNANLLLRNNVIIVLKRDGDLPLKDLSLRAGIPEGQLKPFLEGLVKENIIKKKKDNYSV